MPGVFIVILRNHIGAMGGLVVLVVAVGERIDEPHVQRHLPGVVGGDEHLRLLFPLVQWRAAQYGGIAGLGELDELLYELPLVGRRGMLCSISFFSGRSMPMSAAVRKSVISE